MAEAVEEFLLQPLSLSAIKTGQRLSLFGRSAAPLWTLLPSIDRSRYLIPFLPETINQKAPTEKVQSRPTFGYTVLRPVKRLMTKMTSATTRSRCINPPPICANKPINHNTRRITRIVHNIKHISFRSTRKRAFSSLLST